MEGNIILAKRGKPELIKLIDFGLSGQCTQDQKTFSNTCGTPIFMAPEFYRYPNYSKVSFKELNDIFNSTFFLNC